MTMTERQLSPLDKLICGLDATLRTLSPGSQTAGRANPAAELATEDSHDDEARKHSAGLMRVNHSGEVCAQALYQGQAISAKLPQVRDEMERAAQEEVDHLVWCEQRLRELDSRPSVLNPLWYALSFAIGATAGKVSDRISLGFVAATEEQVCKHLQGHLETLPEGDERSRAIVSQMLEDEGKHAHMALEAGGLAFPKAFKSLMTLVSKAMTASSYRI